MRFGFAYAQAFGRKEVGLSAAHSALRSSATADSLRAGLDDGVLPALGFVNSGGNRVVVDKVLSCGEEPSD